MNRFICNIAVILTLVTIPFSLSTPALAVEDAIIAIVDDELITLNDLKDYVQSTYVGLVAEGLSDSQIKTYMKELELNGITKLIEDKLVLSQANKIGLQVREELVDDRIKSLEEKYGSYQGMVDALVRSGSTITDLRNKITDQFKIQYVLDHEVKSTIYVNPQEVTDYYEKNKDKFNQDDRVHLESIYFAYGDDKEAALNKAKDVLEQIKKDEKNFLILAEQYSEAPSVGTIERGQLLPTIEEEVFDLKLNEISPLVEVETGAYIFKLTGRTAARASSIDDVKDIIYDRLYKEKFRQKFTRWVQKLKDDAYVEIKE